MSDSQNEPIFDRGGFLRRSGAAVAGLTMLGAAGSGAALAQGTRPRRNAALAPIWKGDFGMANWPLSDAAVPTLVAIERGLFKAQRLNLSMVAYASGTDVARAVNAGQLNLGGGGYLTALGAYGAGLTEIRCVGTASKAQSLSYAVAADSPIKTVADLKGKKIATDSSQRTSPYYLLTQMLASAGLTPNDVTVVFLGGTAVCQTAVENGVVDAGFVIDPAAAQSIAEGKIRMLWRAAQGPPSTSKFTETAYFSNARFIANKPDVITRWLTAQAQAQQWIRHNPKQAAAIWAKSLHYPANVALASLTPALSGMTIDPSISGFNWAKKAGVIIGTVQPTLSYYSFNLPQFAKPLAARYSK